GIVRSINIVDLEIYNYQGGLKLNYNQNQKIAQITPSTLIVGIDIAKDKHVARFQDDRGMEFGKRVFFDNRIHGFELLLERVAHIQKDEGKPTSYLALNQRDTIGPA